MISKLAKAHESWAFKIISLAVAVSFISLFGVTGYINSATQNQTVIKVGRKKITQSEFSYRLNRELSALKNLGGEDFEVSNEMRSMLADTIVKQFTDDAVLDGLMDKYNIRFPKEFIQMVLFSQKEFQNPLNGQFSPDIFKRYLSSVNMSEDEYVASIKRMLARQILIADTTKVFNIPGVLVQAMHKMDNQRKSFKYVTISPDDVMIERQISDDEIEQYFEDFSENFTIPETRDIRVLFVPLDYIVNKYVANEDKVRDYFEQNKDNFDEPEKRNVLQMVFLNEESAQKAFGAVQNGADFSQVAKEFNAENAGDPSLGIVSKDELADDLANPVFNAEVKKVFLIQVADSWQVIEVDEIIPAKKADFDLAKDEIIETLKNDNLYEAMRDVRALIDDAVNGGQDLNTVGKTLGIEPIVLDGVLEESLITNAPEVLNSTVQTLDLNELAFSYGIKEISSAEELDDGIAVVEVANIVEAHLPDVDKVKDQIVALWTVQEKDAIAKEIADDIIAEAKDGSSLSDTAKAHELEVFRSAPVSRNETFSSLTSQEIADLFTATDNEVKVFEHKNNNFVIVTPIETVNFDDELTDEELKSIKQRASYSFANDMYQDAMKNYSNDFKIKVDYKLIGFEE